MQEIDALMKTLKRRLRINGLNYRDVATKIGLSEASVKRLFAAGDRMVLSRFIEICHLLGFTLAEIAEEAELSARKLHTLSDAQEKELVADARLLLIAVCVIDKWSIPDILQHYQFTEAECIGYLVKLDRLGLISLLPGNRVRLNLARDFDWLPQGPIRQFFKKEGFSDFLNHPFMKATEVLHFSHAMLTEEAAQKLALEIRKWRQKVVELHEECGSAPLDKRYGTGVFIAMRPWVPEVFVRQRRLR